MALSNFKFLSEHDPVLAEIGAEAEKLFAIDTAACVFKLRLLDAIPSLVDKFRQSVLARAFSGELTAEWRKNNPDVEPASELLKRIRIERRQKWIEDYAQNLTRRAQQRALKNGKPWTDDHERLNMEQNLKKGAGKYVEPEPVDAEKEGLPELPKGWEWVTLGELCHYVTSGSRGWGEYYADNGALFIRIGDLSHPGIDIDYRDAQKVELPDHVEGKRARLTHGDILVSITADVGSIGVVDEALGMLEAYINQHIALCRPCMPAMAKYMGWALYHPWGAQKLVTDIEYGATKASLNLDQVRALPIPLSPVREQLQILQIVSSMGVTGKAVIENQVQSFKGIELLKSALLSSTLMPEYLP